MIIQRKLIDSRLLIYDVCQRITNAPQHEIKHIITFLIYQSQHWHYAG